ncbi:TetR/AcrR family transcriptional regulator [Catellatospora sp. NPDC049609]|uniref:TetR/AcrR family transcriptional regulator n=1 Tax=Catellatospora sp. NPDC049609 TaxID=3155505 RepID=UPI00342E3475
MTVYGGQGDPARTMALLWRNQSPTATPDLSAAASASARTRRAPGPRQGLTVDTIVEAAIALADADGMDKLSMRAVGERLGTSAMALYTYVPSKRELVDLMYDHAHAGLPHSYDLTAGREAAVHAWTGDLWARYLAHPWLLQVSFARPVLGPHEQAVLEALLGILHGTEVTAGDLRPAVSALFHLVRGAAQTAAESRAAATATGTPDEQWWTERSAQLATVVPDFTARFPHSAALSATPPDGAPTTYDPVAHTRHTLDAAVTLLLTGLR